MKVTIYIEGGGSAELDAMCRDGFRKLFDKSGIRVNLVACGSRSSAFDRFKTGIASQGSDEIALLLVDSEDPVNTNCWQHVKNRKGDGWDKPAGVSEDQLLFMATCMEAWVLADRDSGSAYFGQKFNMKALGSDSDLEQRDRKMVFSALERASKDCTKRYSKGKISFELLGKLDPEKLSALSHWNRCVTLIKQVMMA